MGERWGFVCRWKGLCDSTVPLTVSAGLKEISRFILIACANDASIRRWILVNVAHQVRTAHLTLHVDLGNLVLTMRSSEVTMWYSVYRTQIVTSRPVCVSHAIRLTGSLRRTKMISLCGIQCAGALFALWTTIVVVQCSDRTLCSASWTGRTGFSSFWNPFRLFKLN